MKKLPFHLLPIILLVVVCRLAGQEKVSYKIVVNQMNPVTSMTKAHVSRLFLKKNSQWANGTTALPVDLVDSSQVRQKFSKEIHGKTVAAIRAYWQQRIFSGRDIPPPAKATDAEVISFVQENPGAIGYVSPNATTPKVKVLQVTP